MDVWVTLLLNFLLLRRWGFSEFNKEDWWPSPITVPQQAAFLNPGLAARRRSETEWGFGVHTDHKYGLGWKRKARATNSKASGREAIFSPLHQLHSKEGLPSQVNTDAHGQQTEPNCCLCKNPTRTRNPSHPVFALSNIDWPYGNYHFP